VTASSGAIDATGVIVSEALAMLLISTSPATILKNAVGREKDVQAIDLDSVMKKCVVTLLVISIFFI
jgi:hypothetical protein